MDDLNTGLIQYSDHNSNSRQKVYFSDHGYDLNNGFLVHFLNKIWIAEVFVYYIDLYKQLPNPL